MKNTVLLCLCLSFQISAGAQVLVMSLAGNKYDSRFRMENGYLPGKKFPFYKAIGAHNFNGLKLRIELYDDRTNLQLKKVNCSDVNLENASEFADPNFIRKVQKYLDTLSRQSGIILDTASQNKVTVRLEALDSRQIGFGQISVHGICQIKVTYQDIAKTYCIDIVDGDKNAPLGRTAITTRKTAARYMTSASVREVIEQFFVDLERSQ